MTVDVETRLRASFHALTDALPASPPPPVPRLPAAPVRHPARRVVLGGFAVAAAGSAVAVDQYLYVRSVGRVLIWGDLPGGGRVTVLASNLDQIWQAVDPARAGLHRQTAGTPTFFHAGDDQRARAAGLLDGPTAAQDTAIPGHFSGDSFTTPSWPFLAGLPTDPGVLYRQVEDFSRGHGPSLHEEMLVTIGDALKYSTAPPAVVAALYEVAARVPGVELVPGAVDVAGRRGIAVALTSYWTRRELIFDDSTGTFLGARELFAHAQMGYPAGTLFTSQATTVTVVDAIGQTAAVGPS